MKLGQKVSFTSKEEFQKVLRKGYRLVALPGILSSPWKVWENNNLYLCKCRNAKDHEINGLYNYLIQVIEVPSVNIKFTV